MKNLFKATMVLSVLSAAVMAQTATPGFELERLTLNPGAKASLWASTGDLLEPSDWRVSLAGHYENRPLIYLVDDHRAGSVVKNRVTAHLAFAYGLFKWLELGAQVPVVAWQSGDDLTAFNIAKPESLALGTPFIQGRFGFLKESGGDALDLAAHLGIGLPLGNPNALTRDSFITIEPRIGAGKTLGLFRVGGELGAQLRNLNGSVTLSQNAQTVRDEIGSRFGAGLVVNTTNKGLRGELGGRLDVPFTKTGVGGEILAGGRYAFNDLFEAYVLAGAGFGSMPGIPAFRVLLGVSAGGLKEPGPVCKGAPSSTKGCDFDNDGILNELDACVELAGLPDRKGCPIFDADKDGIEDDLDACPKEAGVKERKGCPIRDADKDGIEDKDDQCPMEAGPKERKGCPIHDADKDGIEDKDDACPNEAGSVERKGCPVRDADNDGVPDEIDNCPKEPGPKENQGCKAKQLVVITKEKLVIKDKVFFETGKSTILAKSFALLTQVADVLKAHPEVQHVTVEGHTDSKGKREANLKLSQDRAGSVMKYLTGKGVEASRLNAKGFGPDKPIDTNDTEPGRANNRRVEFVIETPETVKETTIK